MTDHDLRSAFHALRDRHDGHHPDEGATLRRALLATRQRERTRRMTRWAVLPIAAVLVASTAWAGATGRLAPVMRALTDTLHSDQAEPRPAPLPAASGPATAAPAASAAHSVSVATEDEPEVVTPEPTPTPVPPIAVAPRATEPAPAARPPPVIAQPSVTVAPDPAPPPAAASADPASALFADAHRIHFVDKDPARAVAAWDAYLKASPNGRFVPEARYNRALALVRLGRIAEAERELSAFAGGAYGTYRREDARALLEALKKDASP
jgi:hypothetical protein